MNTLLPLTEQQKNIWNTEMFYSGTSVNNSCGYIYIDQNVDFDLIEKTANLYVKHTDSIKYHFIYKDDVVFQYESNYEKFKVDVIDVKDMDEANTLSQNLLNEPFEIIDSNLFKFTAYRLPNGKGGLIVQF